MYLCLCKGITEEMLNEVRKKGLRGKAALKALGLGSECGTCLLQKLPGDEGKISKKPLAKNPANS